jgi:histidyl-tRNA synthetase
MNDKLAKPIKIQPLQGVKGMNDIIPPTSAAWDQLEETLRRWARSFGYQHVRTPILEHTALFKRGIGEVTDIVEKEMYSFTDALNGEQLTLRPENTAGVVRAAIEHNLLYDGPKRLWYFGPMFRHERPQRGRFRQFYQVGAEALGFAGPEADVEVISMGQRLWDELGLKGIRLELNSIGDAHERQAHRAELIAYFEAHSAVLDEDGRRRLHSNPLRILDTKNPAMQDLVNAAPKLDAFLGPESKAHFEQVQQLLRDLAIPYKLNPRLVRGLDYYNRTVFEWVTDELGSQGTVCGGGRYDPLIQMLGGKAAPACGFAMGVERLLDLMQQQGIADQGIAELDVYVVHTGEAAQSMAVRAADALRRAGLDVICHAGGGSFKAQFKRADASGAQFAVIIGDDELAANRATVKNLRREAQQESVPFDDLAQAIMRELIA